MTTLPIVQVDAFADRPFTGNPAAVCLLPRRIDDGLMQQIASEMNLSETAFAEQMHDAVWRLRWFTPVNEVDLCGHATLATAHVIWQEGRAPSSPMLEFQTRSGRLTAERAGENITLDFPAQRVADMAVPEELLKALGIEKARYGGRNGTDWLIELDNEGQVRTISPDMTLLSRLEVRGVMVTAVARDHDTDFVSRFFAPRCGIDEDPVTGSAHCALAPFWMERLGRNEMVGRQLSARGGVVRVEVRGERVRLTGRAITVMRGELQI